MSGRTKLAAVFVAGVLAMAAVFGVLALVDTGGGDGSVQNVSTATPSPTRNGNASNVVVDENCQTAADIYEKLRPSVVEVDITGLSGLGGSIQGTGTGIVLDGEGHILTNNHVIENANEVIVKFDDGETVTASVVGSDSQNDLAVIKVSPSDHDLTPAKIGDSSKLRVGDPVVAIGNPFNLEGSLTAGIVSGLNRAYSEGNSTRPIRGMIQTDAAINPGNSGGPLINCYGEVVGVNTLLENPTGDTVNVGVGFAVASNTVNAEVDELKAGKAVQHAWLGIAGLDLTSAVAKKAGLEATEGVYVTLVNPNSPADEAGLVGAFATQNQANNATEVRPGGDVIVKVDGKDVKTIDEVATYLDQSKKPGDKVELGIVRNGKEQTITATLAEWPGS